MTFEDYCSEASEILGVSITEYSQAEVGDQLADLGRPHPEGTSMILVDLDHDMTDGEWEPIAAYFRKQFMRLEALPTEGTNVRLVHMIRGMDLKP